MKFLHFLIHLVVLTFYMLTYLMWVAPVLDNRGMIIQLGTLSLGYMAIAFATEWLVHKFFIRSKYKPVVLKDGVTYYGDEGLAIEAAMSELALDSLKHTTVVQQEDTRGNYLYLYDTIRKIYSDKYYFQIKETIPL